MFEFEHNTMMENVTLVTERKVLLKMLRAKKLFSDLFDNRSSIYNLKSKVWMGTLNSSAYYWGQVHQPTLRMQMCSVWSKGWYSVSPTILHPTLLLM